MSKGKKALAIFLTVWGSIVTIIGVFLLVIWADMLMAEVTNSSYLEAYWVLGAILLTITVLPGILPLVFGIKLLRRRELKR